MSGYILARTIRQTAAPLLRAVFSTHVTGSGNIPAGGAILAGNHVSYLDPILMWCVSPRPVHFMAKRELWDHWLNAWALPRLWAFPVNRGEADRTAITTATDLLRSGELVGVFPEGHRSEDGGASLGEAQGGAAFIALRADVPIVPVAFVGTEKAWPAGVRFPRIGRTRVRIGSPIRPADVLPAGGRKERVLALTAELMERIAILIDEARRGAA